MNQPISEILLKPIRFIRGVGEARAQLFEKLGLVTISDLVTFYPRQYEDRNNIKKIGELTDGETCGIDAVVVIPVHDSRLRRNLTISKAKVADGTGAVLITWFNQSYIKNNLKQNERYVFFGKVSVRFGIAEMQNPVFERVSDTMNLTCRIIPVYSATAGLTQGVIRNTIKSALEMTANLLPDIFPTDIRSAYGLSEINYSVNNIHFPSTDEDFMLARKRLVFEELFLLQIGLMSIKQLMNTDSKSIVFD